MFKLSTVETQARRKLIIEGKLMAPWTQEVEKAWHSAQQQLEGRKLIIDLRNVTVISADGENTLLHLMREGARFTCGGVLNRHLLRILARRCRCEG